MIHVSLDSRGRLTSLEAIPPERVESTASPQNFDWKTLFDAAGFDFAQFQAAQPTWNSLAASDTRAAWTGKWPGTNRDLRIEAAAFQGKPVYFALIGPWTHPQRMQPEEPSAGKKFGNVLGLILLISLIVFSSLLARRNYRQGRGDRDGAAHLAKVVFILLIGLWALRTHHVADFGELETLILTTSTALFLSGITFVLYLAAEPYVRKFWPHSIISWSRLLAGRVRDPLVGRDVLFGVVLGVVWVSIFKIDSLILARMGAAPNLYSTDFLDGTRRALGAWLYQVPSSILGTLEFFFLALGLKVLLRRDWIAAIAFVALFSALQSAGSKYPWVDVPVTIVVYSIAVLIIYRFGLISVACAVFTVDLLANVPFTADLSAWYMSTSIFALLSVIGLAIWGFHTSLAGEPLWKPDVS
jgi:serine/threonine-protein kinase